MHSDAPMVFTKMPGALPLYDAVEQFILENFEDVEIRVRTTQVGFFSKHGFAWVSLPPRKIKSRTGLYVVLTFGLPYEVGDRRIIQSVEPYPGRFTHHMLIEEPSDLDAQVLGWLRESYAFARSKRGGK